ncbi:PREDICTED: DUF21 domain-containing protein At5g52790 isoform X2 [Tarenaya hassleriana]|uniref:DUF21 domain-containing protein At5g52790 isoform X2 n=1 Tax=Tarenaya hassleriana TaxID=28532 RepID=UPI00053C11A8|nr:PREDICTED: DUF21 domain-containing protein At5g52790 isoform X2 [Tarenaya hassleriana]
MVKQLVYYVILCCYLVHSSLGLNTHIKQTSVLSFEPSNDLTCLKTKNMAANDVPCCETMFWVYLIICVALVLFAGLMSGLTLGLMSLSLVELEVMIKAGEPHERRNAGNAMAMEALPIFVDALLPAWGAILISVTLILAFGEILPQAVCSRYGLSIGAKLSFLVRLIVIVLFPLAYPISKLLDWLLGKHQSSLLRRAELKMLVHMHGNEAGKGGELTRDETTIISGALDMTQKTAKDAMTPISEIFSLDINTKLDEKTLGLIASEGHSRVPIYSGIPRTIIGFILVKNLIKIRAEDETTIRDIPIRRMPRVNTNLPLYDILNIFQTGRSHMAAVVEAKNVINGPLDHKNAKGLAYKSPPQAQRDDQVILSIPGTFGNEVYCQSPVQYIDSHAEQDEELVGIITLEDVMEELIQEEIFDETDRYVEVYKRLTVKMLPPEKSPEKSTWISDLGRRSHPPSPITPHHQSPLSSNSITPTLLRSPVKSPYPKSPVIRPKLYASPSRYSPALCSDIDCSSSLSPNRVSRTSYVKLPRPDVS